MAVNSSKESQDAFSISVLADESNNDPKCVSKLATLSHSEVPIPLNNKDRQNHVNQEMENANMFSPCIVDIYIEKENSETPKTSENAVEKLKIEGPLTHLQRGLQRQIGLHIDEKLMQLLMNDSFVLPKFISRDKSATERLHETPNTRTRKYKRSASFSSRKVVLLFSVLSSIGSMILIILTLRLRQIANGSLHI